MKRVHVFSREVWFSSPKFLVCAISLTLAGIGLRPAIAVLIDYYSKLPIDIRRPLADFDGSNLESFRQVELPEHIAISQSAQDVGTDEYVTFKFEDLNGEVVSGVYPGAFLMATYYSDPRSRVPHTPEVCYRQDGTIVHSMTTVPVSLKDHLGNDFTIDARLLDMERQVGRLALLYVFCCNGKFYYDRERVRLAIGLPGDKYTYFSKVETFVPYDQEKDFQEAADRCMRLMQEALPVFVEAHYPLNDDLTRR